MTFPENAARVVIECAFVPVHMSALELADQSDSVVW